MSTFRNPEPTIAKLNCSPDVRMVLRRAVAWEPYDRYPDADAMMAELRSVLDQQPTKDAGDDVAQDEVYAQDEDHAQAQLYRAQREMERFVRLKHLAPDRQALKLEAAREAVARYRQLAALRPDAFQPDLARKLQNLGMLLRDFGQREAAFAATREAVGLYYEMAKRNPDAFQPHLAEKLFNLYGDLTQLAQPDEALAAIREAVALYRLLATRRPDAVRYMLVMSLDRLAKRLSDVGQHEEALTANREAEQLRRQPTR